MWKGHVNIQIRRLRQGFHAAFSSAHMLSTIRHLVVQLQYSQYCTAQLTYIEQKGPAFAAKQPTKAVHLPTWVGVCLQGTVRLDMYGLGYYTFTSGTPGAALFADGEVGLVDCSTVCLRVMQA